MSDQKPAPYQGPVDWFIKEMAHQGAAEQSIRERKEQSEVVLKRWEQEEEADRQEAERLKISVHELRERRAAPERQAREARQQERQIAASYSAAVKFLNEQVISKAAELFTAVPELKNLRSLQGTAPEAEKSLILATRGYINTILDKIKELNDPYLQNKAGKLDEISHAIRAARYFIAITLESDQFKQVKGKKNELAAALVKIDNGYLAPLSQIIDGAVAQKLKLQAAIDAQFQLNPPKKEVKAPEPKAFMSASAMEALAEPAPIPPATTAQAALQEIDGVYQAAKTSLLAMNELINLLDQHAPETAKARQSYQKIASLVGTLKPKERFIADTLEERLEQLRATCTLVEAECASMHVAALKGKKPQQIAITKQIRDIFSGKESNFGKLRNDASKLAERVANHGYVALILPQQEKEKAEREKKLEIQQLEKQAASHIQEGEVLPAFACYQRLCALTKQQTPQGLLRQAILNWDASQHAAALSKLIASSDQNKDAQKLIPVVHACLLLVQAEEHLEKYAFDDALVCLETIKKLLTTDQFTPSGTDMLKEVISNWDADQCQEVLEKLAAVQLPQKHLTEGRAAVIKQCLEERRQAAQAEAADGPREEKQRVKSFATPAETAFWARLRNNKHHNSADFNLASVYRDEGIEAVQRKIIDFTHAEYQEAYRQLSAAGGDLAPAAKQQIISLLEQGQANWERYIEPELVKKWQRGELSSGERHFTMFASSQDAQKQLYIKGEKRDAEKDLDKGDVIAAYKCYKSVEQATKGKEKAEKLFTEAIEDWDAARCTAALASLAAAKPDAKQGPDQQAIQQTLTEFARRHRENDNYSQRDKVRPKEDAIDRLNSTVRHWDVAHCHAALTALGGQSPRDPRDANSIAIKIVERHLAVATQHAEQAGQLREDVAAYLQQRLATAKAAEQQAAVVAGPAAPGAAS